MAEAAAELSWEVSDLVKFLCVKCFALLEKVVSAIQERTLMIAAIEEDERRPRELHRVKQ